MDDSGLERWWLTWQLLCRRFSREPVKAEAAAYLQYLEALLTPAQLDQAVRIVWADREYFPRPVDFVNAAHAQVLPSIRREALGHWRRDGGWVERLGGRESLAGRVVAALGGMTQVERLLEKGNNVFRYEVEQAMSETLRAEVAAKLPPLLPYHEPRYLASPSSSDD